MHNLKITEGRLLKGRYKILSKVGEGGFAAVYCAFDELLNRKVAIKVLKSTQDSDSSARFLREAKLLSQLTHKNIVSIFAFDLLDESVPFIVMEYLTGSSLQALLSERRKLSCHQLMSLLNQLCEGLSFVHEAKIIHRDLSTANIFLVADGDTLTVKLIDFGISKAPKGGGATVSINTGTGFMIGNPSYMSPEACIGMPADVRSDIYSLGCIIYECLSGVRPFIADTPMGIIFKQQNEYPKELVFNSEDFDSGSEKALAQVALRCIQKDPNKRFQSCREILNCLSEIKKGGNFRRVENLDGWGAPENGSLHEHGMLSIFHSGKKAIATPKAAAFICTVFLLCLIVTVYIVNSDRGQVLLAKLSLQHDHSRFNFLYWLNCSERLKAEGKQFASDTIAHEIEDCGQGSLTLPNLYLDLAKAALAQGNNQEAFNDATKCLTQLKTNRKNAESYESKIQSDKLVSDAFELISKSKIKLSADQYILLSSNNLQNAHLHSNGLRSRLQEIFSTSGRTRAEQLIPVSELEGYLPEVRKKKNYLYVVNILLSIKYYQLQDTRGWTVKERDRYPSELAVYSQKEEKYLKDALACCILPDGQYYQDACQCFQHFEFLYWNRKEFKLCTLNARKAIDLFEKVKQNQDIPILNTLVKCDYLRTANIPYMCNMHLAQIALLQNELSAAKKYALEALKFHQQADFGWGGEPEALICLADIAWEAKDRKESMAWMEEFEKQTYLEELARHGQEAESESIKQGKPGYPENAYAQALVMSALWYRAHKLNDIARKAFLKAHEFEIQFPKQSGPGDLHRLSKIISEGLANSSKSIPPELSSSQTSKVNKLTDLSLENRI